MEWYHVCWPRLTAKCVEPVVSISWASCFYSLSRSFCQNLRPRRVMEKDASNWRRHVISLTFDSWGHCACRWRGSSGSIRIPSIEVRRRFRSKDGRLAVAALNGSVILTFDLSISKWGHGLTVSWASFLTIFGFVCPSVLDITPDTGQTDGQTETTAINA